ncbi:MAG TPA: hypothetical protein VFV46_09420 [Lacibacter sp.]|nr:hypothetical protein [Lacibacter sp.]
MKKFYAYSQPVTSGMNAREDQPRRSYSIHHLYLETNSGQTITVTGLWIKGQEFLFEQTIITTPVSINSSIQFRGKHNIVDLVPFTTNNVWQIKKLQAANTKQQLPQYLRSYEAVIAYRFNGLTYYVGKIQCKALHPVLSK